MAQSTPDAFAPAGPGRVKPRRVRSDECTTTIYGPDGARRVLPARPA